MVTKKPTSATFFVRSTNSHQKKAGVKSWQRKESEVWVRVRVGVGVRVRVGVGVGVRVTTRLVEEGERRRELRRLEHRVGDRLARQHEQHQVKQGHSAAEEREHHYAELLDLRVCGLDALAGRVLDAVLLHVSQQVRVRLEAELLLVHVALALVPLVTLGHLHVGDALVHREGLYMVSGAIVSREHQHLLVMYTAVYI